MKKSKILVGASILSEDFFDIQKTLKKINSSDLDFIHLDVMDGVFVPNISFGPAFVKNLKCHSEKFFDVHLMISNPLNYIQRFVEAGADAISVHVEAKKTLASIKQIKSFGKKCGIVLNPKTPAKKIKKYLKFIDFVMVMTVEPGFGGQKFMENQLGKISQIFEMIKRTGRKIYLQVDGGVNFDTAKLAINNGVNSLVVGSFLFKQKNFNDTVLKFR
ncbi:MAG: ribulose-phosphate 3-epimerase [Alphaproteobacteria bacterium]|nr:ribulose-phosphate 3-epimerase [Alphaproteobacteria bacterium]